MQKNTNHYQNDMMNKKNVYIYIYTHAHIEVIEITGDIDTINTNSDETKGPLGPMRPAA